MEPIESGCEWEQDPAGNANSHDGRTIRTDVRSKELPRRLAIVKRPKPQLATEIYAIGFERIAYVLGHLLGLPVLPVHLEEVDGHPSSIQRRVQNARSWRQRWGLMEANVLNANAYALSALFDVWLGNTDRRDVNLIFEPLPEGKMPSAATGSRLWLIDHGCCGLWPASKLEAGRAPDDLPTDIGTITGELVAAAETGLAGVMPREYREALKHSPADVRRQLLDLVREVGDDARIDRAVQEVPASFITEIQAEATAAFLKARRDRLDDVLQQYWQP